MQAPARGAPVEHAAFASHLHPGAEQPIEQGLHQAAAEQMLAFRPIEGQPQSFLQGAAQFREGGQGGLFVHPGQSVAGIGGEEERHVLRPGQRGLMEQHAFQELGEAAGEARRAAGAAGQGEEGVRVGAGEAESLPFFRPARSVAAQQDEIAVVGDKHQAVGGQIAAHLLAVALDRDVRRDVVNLHHPAFRRAARRPLVRRVGNGAREQSHVGETRAAVAQVGDAEDARFQFLATGVQGARQGTVIAHLPGSRPRGTNAGDFRQVVRQDVATHAFVIAEHAAFRNGPAMW